MQEAAQAQLPDETAALALIELQTSTNDDVTGDLFKKGRSLPLPTDKSEHTTKERTMETCHKCELQVG
jgi:hypothetical protein